MVNITKNEFKLKHRTETPSTRSDMVTLTNVETGRGQAQPPSVRLAPDTIPEAKSSQTGVSVRYVPFIITTCNNNGHLKFVDEEPCHFQGSETVRIIDGMFKGVEGRVARVSGQQRVIVSVSHVGLASTAYIPTAFIQIIAPIV